MQSLKKNSDKLLSLATEVLTEPRFSQEELDKLKKQAKSGLAQQQDDPEAMSRNITSILNFGKNHPYGEVMTEKSVENISLARCKKYKNVMKVISPSLKVVSAISPSSRCIW
jgi:predicted Zn-dependent peptidase